MHTIYHVYLQKSKEMEICVIVMPWILLNIDINLGKTLFFIRDDLDLTCVGFYFTEVNAFVQY